MKPLEDIRVLSVTVFLAGPFLGMTLARFGAEVIKVEMPGSGDPIRNAGPYHGPKGINAERQTEDDLSIRFLKRSEGVKSVTLNLKDPEGRRMFLEMAKRSDVVIENLSPGSMKRLGLGYEEVSAVNPGIVYCSIAGYGQTGPYKDLPAHDHQIQAMSGIMDMNGSADGPPTRIGVFVGDLVTPLYAAYSILGALRHREKTGEGQYLDASMIDTLATLMFMEPMEHVLHEGQPVRAGNDSRNDVTGLYRLADGDVIITVGLSLRLKALLGALGASGLLEEARFADPGRQGSKHRRIAGGDSVAPRQLHLRERYRLAPGGGCPGRAGSHNPGSRGRRSFSCARHAQAHVPPGFRRTRRARHRSGVPRQILRRRPAGPGRRRKARPPQPGGLWPAPRSRCHGNGRP